MTQHVLTHRAIAFPHGDGSTGTRLLHFMVDRFLFLPVGVAIALIWANTAAESYFTWSHRMAFAVNEIGMALFFALITQEIVEELMPGGALHTWRRWTMALVAAAGGTLGAALTYVAYVRLSYEEVLLSAWPVATAIDIAAAYFVLKLICRRSVAIPFVLLLAVATNAFTLIFVGLRHPIAATHPGGTALFVGAIGLAAMLRRLKVRTFWPYLALCGGLSWWAFYWDGLHPALALVPIVPFLPHEARRQKVFEDVDDPKDATRHFEHEWNLVVQIVLFLFGVVNGGVTLHHYDTGTWAILTATLIGRPLGIVGAVAIALALHLHLPAKFRMRELVVLAFATSSGFTFALFAAGGIFPYGPTLAQIKIGALSSVVAVLLAIGAARVLRVGRFAH